MQGSNRIFNSLRHCIHFALFSDILVTDNGIDGSFHGREVFVLVLLQSICLGNGCINLSIINVLVLQGSNRIFNSLRHCIHFALFSDILVTDNGIDGSFHGREVFVLVLLQSICLGNGCINLSIINVLVLQGSNGIFNSLRHCIHFGLLRKVLTTGHSIYSGFHAGEVLVVILLQSVCFGNGCINLCVISILVLQGSNGIFNSLRHCIHFGLLRKVLTTGHSIHSGFHGGEVLVVILVHGICFGDGCVNLCVISILVLQGSNGIFNSLRHCVYISLLRQHLSAYYRIDSSFHSRKVLVVIFFQSICLGNGRIYAAIVGRAIDFQIVANLRKRIAQQTCHCAICKIFFCLFSSCTCVFRYSARSEEAVGISNRTAPPQVARKNTGSLISGHSGSLGRKRCLIYIAVLNS